MEPTSVPLDAWAGLLGLPTPRHDRVAHANSAVWRVTADDGRAYVLKAVRGSAGAPLADMHRVLAYLAEVGLPVAPPIPTDDGRSSVEHEGFTYVLCRMLPVDHTNHELGPDGPTTARAIGRAIGDLHEALDACPWTISSYVLDIGPRAFDESYPRLPAAVTRDTVDRISADVLAALDDLPMQRIHGDCHGGNVLVHDGEVTGFVDLDHLPIGARVYDLGYYLAHRVRVIVSVEDDRERERVEAAFLSVLGHYVEGYHEANPLTPRERAAIVPVMIASEVILTEWNLRHIADQAEWYRHGVESLRWICERYDTLRACMTPAGGVTGGEES